MINILTQREIGVSGEVKINEDVRYSSSQDSPLVTEKREVIVVLDTDSKVKAKSNLEVDEVKLGVDVSSPSTVACRKTRRRTQTW